MTTLATLTTLTGKAGCMASYQCPSNKRCISSKCRDPCPGVCGREASCKARNHYAICQCKPGYTGDPFVACQRITTCEFLIQNAFSLHFNLGPTKVSTERPDPCIPTPCGSKALCTEKNNAVSCRCEPGYTGDPFLACQRITSCELYFIHFLFISFVK